MDLVRLSRLALGAFFAILFAVTTGGPFVRSAVAAPEEEGARPQRAAGSSTSTGRTGAFS